LLLYCWKESTWDFSFLVQLLMGSQQIHRHRFNTILEIYSHVVPKFHAVGVATSLSLENIVEARLLQENVLLVTNFSD